MASIRFTTDAGPVEVTLSDASTIGRARTNSIAIPNDRFASKEHARILRVDDAFLLEDLASRNGTSIERGDRKMTVVGSERLQNGDVIGVGGLRLVFLSGTRTAARRQGSGQATAEKDFDPNQTQIGAFPLPGRQAPDETVIVRRRVPPSKNA